MKKNLLIILAALIIAGAAAAYSKIAENIAYSFKEELGGGMGHIKKINFIHWGDFPKEVFNGFSRKYPEISVVFENFDREYYPTIQKVRIASGENVDVMGVPEYEYADFASKGYLVDLSDRGYLFNYMSDIREDVRKMHYEGKEYAVAYKSSVFGIWYNKILFNKYNIKVPSNYQEFLQACSILKSNNVDPLILGGRDERSAGYLLLLRMLNVVESDDNWYMNFKNKKSKWTDDKIKSVFKDISFLISEGYIAEESPKLTYHQAFADFAKGRAAMIIMEDTSLNLVKGDIDKVCEPGVFPLPYNDTGETMKAAGRKASYLTGIFSESKNLKEADLLIEYLSTPEAAQIYCDITLSVPTIKRVDTSELKYNYLWIPLRSLEYISPVFTDMDNDMSIKLNKSLKELLAGVKDYSQIAVELQEEQDRLDSSIR